MDPNLWEIKWAFRDDCVNALMVSLLLSESHPPDKLSHQYQTLRRVPHLTVSWAHHPPSASTRYDNSNTNTPPTFGSRFSLSPSHARPTAHPHLNFIHEYGAAGELVSPSTHSAGLLNPLFSEEIEQSPNSDVWAFAHSTPFLRGPNSPAQGTDLVAPLRFPQKSPKWSETDFPPLRDMPATDMSFRRDPRRWGDRDVSERPNLAKEDSVTSEPHATASIASAPSCLEVDVLGTSYDPDPVRNSSSPSVTPDPSLSPITPVTPKTVVTFLRTPKSSTDAIGVEDASHFGSYKSPGHFDTPTSGFNGAHRSESAPSGGSAKEIDRTTIFVGGLEMYGPNTWDEARLHDVFVKYGKIEDIQLVRPRKSSKV